MMKPPPSLFPTSLLQKGRVSPYMIFTSLFVVFILFITIIYGENFRFSRFYSPNYPYSGQDQTLSSTTNQKLPPFAIGETEKGCDVFSGTWVWDDVGHPLYEESECPYIQPQLTCQEHGRPDKDYRHWRWQPHACSLPSFNSSLMLETLRDKRMMFVGDSLSRGQYVSMVCLLHKIIPDQDAKSMQTLGSLFVFTAKEYNATIEFYWAPFLLESNSDNQNFLTSNKRFVRRGSINKHGDNWKGVDIIVFSTYEWWITTGPNINVFKQGSLLGDVEKDMETLSTEDAYSMTMQDMVGWVKENMDPNKTRVFFTSMSPSHKKSVDWGGDSEGNCYNETTMIQDPNYWGSESSKSVMRLIESVFGKSTVPITFLNITQLSSYRKDGHTSIYKKQWGPLTNEQLADPASYADCLHWCLPGVHDTWNELLFAKLFYP